MPRIKLQPEPVVIRHPELVDELAAELRSEKDFGQPLVIEEPFGGTEDKRVTVFWDKFDLVPDEERTHIILRADEKIDPSSVEHIAVALGLTFPEADEEGALRYQVFPQPTRTTTLTLDDCHKAMRSLGASVLRDPNRPLLLYPRMKNAGEAITKLDEILPGSRGIWIIAEEPHRKAALL